MGVLGPIATKGDLAGDFRACLITKCASGYIRTHHNGQPSFAGPGKDHGRIWTWYINLIQGPNGAFEEDRYRKYVMAELERVLPATTRTTVNALRQVARANVAANAAMVNAGPANVAPNANSQTLTNSAQASVAQQSGGPSVGVSSTPNVGPNVAGPTPGLNNPSTSTLQPPHMSGIGSRLRTNKRRQKEMTESDDNNVSDMGESDDDGRSGEDISSSLGESEQSDWDDDDDEAEVSDAEVVELPPRKRRRH